MRLQKIAYGFLLIVIILSCSNEDNGHTRGIPVINSQTFEISEAVTNSEIIGNVQSDDPNGDPLTFQIGADNSNLFKVSKSGELRLIKGKNLDFETAREHKFTVRVTDGKGEFFNYVTVMVLDENETAISDESFFAVNENISDIYVIGTIKANDPENDVLSFEISVNDNDLFEITKAGELSLTSGKTLDFNTAEEHKITVEVSDGNTASMAEVTITVIDGVDIVDQTFEVNEDITDADFIGTVIASNPQNDVLTFDIVANDNELFKITEDGMLSLANGEVLDFETSEEHNITISASDGIHKALVAEVIITVVDIAEADPRDTAAFVTTWQTTSDAESIVIGNVQGFDYDHTINWGDGTVENIANDMDPEHIYDTAGTYTVAIVGDFPGMDMFPKQINRPKLLSVEQWGAQQWQSLIGAFYRCINMDYNATDIPNLTQVTDMSFMFSGVKSINSSIVDWDVSSVTNMHSMFRDVSSFNQDLSEWDVSSVTDMSFMFFNSVSFNQELGAWDLTSIQEMEFMINNSGLSPVNYDATLIGWDDNPNTPDNITLGADGINYCSNFAAAARGGLTVNKGWTITDDGQNCNP